MSRLIQFLADRLLQTSNMGNNGLSQNEWEVLPLAIKTQGHSNHYPGSIWNSGSTNDGSSSSREKSFTTKPWLGSGGGVGSRSAGGFGNLFGGALSGAFRQCTSFFTRPILGCWNCTRCGFWTSKTVEVGLPVERRQEVKLEAVPWLPAGASAYASSQC